MIRFADVTKKNIIEHNPKQPQAPNHPYRILINQKSECGKTNALLNLMNHKLYINKISLYAKDPFEAKHQFLINKHNSASLKHCNDSKAFIKYSSDMDNIYENIK